jgi:hypothetical protein
VARAYLDARAAGELAKACDLLSSSEKRRLVRLLKGVNGCVEAIRAITALSPKSDPREAASIDEVLSLRVNGAHALFRYRDGAGRHRALPLQREGTAWKVAALGEGGFTATPH